MIIDEIGYLPFTPEEAKLFFQVVLGYSGKSRYAAFYWEAVGDELVWEDGRAKLIGANWPAWLIFVPTPV